MQFDIHCSTPKNCKRQSENGLSSFVCDIQAQTLKLFFSLQLYIVCFPKFSPHPAYYYFYYIDLPPFPMPNTHIIQCKEMVLVREVPIREFVLLFL